MGVFVIIFTKLQIADFKQLSNHHKNVTICHVFIFDIICNFAFAQP